MDGKAGGKLLHHCILADFFPARQIKSVFKNSVSKFSIDKTRSTQEKACYINFISCTVDSIYNSYATMPFITPPSPYLICLSSLSSPDNIILIDLNNSLEKLPLFPFCPPNFYFKKLVIIFTISQIVFFCDFLLFEDNSAHYKKVIFN